MSKRYTKNFLQMDFQNTLDLSDEELNSWLDSISQDLAENEEYRLIQSAAILKDDLDESEVDLLYEQIGMENDLYLEEDDDSGEIM